MSGFGVQVLAINKFQITKAELQQIIKEEYASMAKENARAEEIKARLAAINGELKTLPETLSEVEASGTKKVKSTGWTGAGEGEVAFSSFASTDADPCSAKILETSSPFSPIIANNVLTGTALPCSTPMCKRTPS